MANIRETSVYRENVLADEITVKLSSLGPQFRRRGKDNKTTTAALITPIEKMHSQGMLEVLGGELPPDPLPNALVRLSANTDGLVTASLAINSGLIDGFTSIWSVAVDRTTGREKWSFSKGDHSKDLPSDSKRSLVIRQIIDHAQPAERNIEHYSRELSRWANIRKWNDQDRREAQSALMMAELHHQDVIRVSGEPYIEHAWQTARQLWEWKVRDPYVIKVALAHDVAEDSANLRPGRDESYPSWDSRVYKLIRRSIGARAARGVMFMTKPPVDVEFENGEKFTVMFDKDTPMTKDLSRAIYYPNIASSSETILIKLADRLHNIRTLWAMPYASIVDTIRETREIYLPMLDLLEPQYKEVKARVSKDFEREIAKYSLQLAARA